MKPWGLAAGVLLLIAGAWMLQRPSAPSFNRDIAPLVHARCGSCHHPGGSAPFSLLDYASVKGRAGQIAELTSRRVMPPWMPDPGGAAFEGDRSLSTAEIALFRRWAEAGAAEGSGSAPPTPVWNDGWQLGEPDRVVTLPEAYVLPAEGRDVYRIFVIPPADPRRRHVRAVEFRPSNARAVHHAFLFIDRTQESLRLDAKDPAPGFPGLHVPASAQAPSGQFLSWQPGKRVQHGPGDFPWTLEPDATLVMQVHMRPTGKPESIRPSVGFYFTDRVPDRTPVKIGLWSHDIDLPAGAPAQKVREEVTLAADVDVYRVLPHAHLLARSLEAKARLPDGTVRGLLSIGSWDFAWQGDYAYREPLFLPKGTVLSMEFTYDNSAGNPRNPNVPQRRVGYGLRSEDEMAELWLQVLPRDPGGAALLERESAPRVVKSGEAYNRHLLTLDPSDARAHAELGKFLIFLQRGEEAERHLRESIRLRPDEVEAHYFLGIRLRTAERPDEAKAEFRAVLRLNPGHAKAQGNLGLILMEQGDLDAAAAAFEAALRLNPADELAASSLAQIRARRRQPR